MGAKFNRVPVLPFCQRLNIDTKCAQWNSFHSVKVVYIEIFVCVTTVDKVLWGVATCICRCARRTCAVALVQDCTRSAAEASVRGDRCRLTGVGGGPYRCFSWWKMAWCRVHPLTRCNCGASGAARAEPILLLRYIWIFIVWLLS